MAGCSHALLSATDEAAGVGEIWRGVWARSVTQSVRWGPLFPCVETVMEGSPAASATGWAGWGSYCGSGQVTAWMCTWTQSLACGCEASSCWTLMDSVRWVVIKPCIRRGWSVMFLCNWEMLQFTVTAAVSALLPLTFILSPFTPQF